MFLNSSIVFLLSTLKPSLNSPLGFAAWLVQELSTLRSTSGRLPKQESLIHSLFILSGLSANVNLLNVKFVDFAIARDSWSELHSPLTRSSVHGSESAVPRTPG